MWNVAFSNTSAFIKLINGNPSGSARGRKEFDICGNRPDPIREPLKVYEEEEARGHKQFMPQQLGLQAPYRVDTEMQA
jgi:hypothetical protein